MAERDIAAWFATKYGHPLGAGTYPPVHPQQEEADNRRIEQAERDREFMRLYGDGR